MGKMVDIGDVEEEKEEQNVVLLLNRSPVEASTKGTLDNYLLLADKDAAQSKPHSR